MALDRTFKILFRVFLPKVKNVMEREFPVIESSTTVIDAFKIAADDNANTIVITENGNPAGVLTRRDLISRCFLNKVDCSESAVKEFMSSPIIAIDADENIFNAYEKMTQNQIKRLVVLNKTKIVGIITLNDIKHLATSTPEAVVFRVGYFLMGVLVTIAIVATILLL